MKIAVVGDGAVGKTSLVLQFTEKSFKEVYLQTIGANFAIKTLTLDAEHNNEEVRLSCWDLAGQEHFASVRSSFYSGALGVIYVYDLTRKETLENLVEWKKEVDKRVPGIPAVMLGNKVDLIDQREVTDADGGEMAKKLDAYKLWETSAKTGENVDSAFATIGMLAYEEAKRREEAQQK